MEQLVKAISEKTGIPESAAEKAVEMVLGELKKKLPAPIAGQLDGILSGDVDPQSLLNSLGGDSGGFLKKLFGGK